MFKEFRSVNQYCRQGAGQFCYGYLEIVNDFSITACWIFSNFAWMLVAMISCSCSNRSGSWHIKLLRAKNKKIFDNHLLKNHWLTQILKKSWHTISASNHLLIRLYRNCKRLPYGNHLLLNIPDFKINGHYFFLK